MPLFHFVWVKLLPCRKSPLKILIGISKTGFDFTIENDKSYHLIKRSRAILGRNLTRDNQTQMALNNATLGGGYYWAAPLITKHYSRFSAHALKTQYNKVERSDSFLNADMEFKKK